MREKAQKKKRENANGTNTGAAAAAAEVRGQLQTLAEGSDPSSGWGGAQAAGRSGSETETERREGQRDDIGSTIPRLKLAVVRHPNPQDLLVQASETTRTHVLFMICVQSDPSVGQQQDPSH